MTLPLPRRSHQGIRNTPANRWKQPNRKMSMSFLNPIQSNLFCFFTITWLKTATMWLAQSAPFKGPSCYSAGRNLKNANQLLSSVPRSWLGILQSQLNNSWLRTWEREPVVSASQRSPAVAKLINDVHGFHVPLLSMQRKIKNEQLLRVPEARHKILNFSRIRYGIKLC